MIYSLENSTVKITASTHGGELHSITGKKEGTEYLWNGDSKYWKYHAPHLFPIIGKVIDSKYRVDEKTYELPAHGIARIADFEFISQTNNSITFELKYSDDSLKVYPYKFSLQVTYTLEENTIKTTFRVINLDDKKIYFSLGDHPAFMCPIEEDDKLEDYYLEFNKKEKSSAMLINEEVYISHNRKEYLNDSNIIPLSKELFKDGLFIFDDLKSNKVSIKSRNHNKSLSVEFDGFPYLGLWAPDNAAPFICIEPWFGHPDYEDFNGEFKEKKGVISLEVEKEFNCSYRIFIQE
ncbi:aldose 1-epimerase family protein [Clostridium vincentii]|uniref:Aldose 1-epimerase n=1 Tax=Clostridium vincentii TaxID=52704 RepID=A0A2T0BF07_9CLOT|nr:aldose 1-epimerase family protein [Clostridium vincentii]PRR82403.1 Aldose 1-epimerase [Clostridium vincentii]